MTDLVNNLLSIAELANADSLLVHRGRFIRASFLLDMRDNFLVIDILDGRVANISANRRPMPPWNFALRAEDADWRKFWMPIPPPGHHDVFALLKNKKLSLEGDIRMFMTHLLYFKQLLALPRGFLS